jgi:hypothetical protein
MVTVAQNGVGGEPQHSLAREFVQFAIDSGVLRFGEFKTKAGRLSPYFFNAGLFDDGAKLSRLAQFYAQALLASGIEFHHITHSGHATHGCEESRMKELDGHITVSRYILKG